ncbi:MAG: ABC transporter substrate-binding protein [Rhodobacteraceae bacterium]|nr:ABC transporter substrate-binding protein [Paracoccaceae bacterium]
MKRRYLIIAGIGVVILAVLAKQFGPAAPTDAQSRSETLTVGIYALSPSFGSPTRALGPPGIFVITSIFDTLTEVAPGGAPIPALALSWEDVEPNRWIFRLRPSVVFSNGEPMDAASVVASIERLRDPSRPTVLSSLIPNIDKVEAVDALTVSITTKQPSASLPSDLSGIWIVPPRAWAETDETAFARAPIGTGPYVVKSWEKNRIELTWNPTSWRKAAIRNLIFVEVPDEAARISALASGAIDAAIQISPDAIDTVADTGGRTLILPGGTVYAIALNAEREGSPFTDRRVRQAANYAVNKEQIAEVLFHGTTVPMGQPASRITAGYDPEIPVYPHDPERARGLLREAGFADGFDLRMEVITNAVPADAAMFASVARNLTDVGIRTEVRSSPLPVFFERFFANSFEGQAFQLGFISMPNLDTLKGLKDFTCDKPGSAPFICLPSIAPLIDEARRETDLVSRIEKMREINRVAHDEALALFLIDAVDLMAVSSRVAGEAPATRILHWEDFALKP